jgi:uncharacterized membrane protein
MKPIRYAIVFCGLTIANAVTLDAVEIRYRMTSLRYLTPPDGQKGYSVHAADISDSGYIVGGIGSGDDGQYPFRTTVDGQGIVLDRPPSAESAWGLGVTDEGMLVGGWEGRGFFGAFRWSESDGMEVLVEITEALAINNLGQILVRNGFWSEETGLVNFGVPWARGNAINDQSQATGGVIPGNPSDAWIWDPVSGIRLLGDIPGGGRALHGLGINNVGQIVGVASTPNGGRGFIWSQSNGFTVLPVAPGWTSAYARDINDVGQAVGVCDRSPNGPRRPTMWDPRRGLILLDEAMDPCGSRPLGLETRAINNAGVILVDSGTNTDSYVLTPYLPGDLDENGTVAFDDLARMLVNFGTPSAAGYADGDTNCDGAVGLTDLATLLTNFGNSLP